MGLHRDYLWLPGVALREVAFGQPFAHWGGALRFRRVSGFIRFMGVTRFIGVCRL